MQVRVVADPTVDHSFVRRPGERHDRVRPALLSETPRGQPLDQERGERQPVLETMPDLAPGAAGRLHVDLVERIGPRPDEPADLSRGEGEGGVDLRSQQPLRGAVRRVARVANERVAEAHHQRTHVLAGMGRPGAGALHPGDAHPCADQALQVIPEVVVMQVEMREQDPVPCLAHDHRLGPATACAVPVGRHAGPIRVQVQSGGAMRPQQRLGLLRPLPVEAREPMREPGIIEARDVGQAQVGPDHAGL
ncbi:hypothetical protein [Methylobacterium tardum]|uniref:hypothetical protein n=1 Tax=Methylobacterium tardum TaxID=374432 RepID=UPI00360FF8B3